jgi:hypothetical protein
VARVYSYLFLAVYEVDEEVVFTNDDEHVCVVRDIDGVFNATVGISTLALVNSVGGNLWLAHSTPATATPFSWRGRQVIMPGGTFAINFDPAVGGVYSCSVSGYRLDYP